MKTSSRFKYILVVFSTLQLVLLPVIVPAIDADFDDLAGWQEQSFLYVKDGSSYRIDTVDDLNVLRVASEGGISALVSEDVFHVYETPMIEWRWRIDDFPSGANPRDESTDDFALRFYVMFEYDEGTIPLGERIKFRFLKAFYDERPPKKVLGYVWSETPFADPYLDSKVNDRTRYLESGENAGQSEWKTMRVNILDEYRRIYGEEPPKRARISIIGDSDSTGDPTLGYVDYVRVSER